MPKPIVNIVSGLPRSGTSMLMKMLDAGGIPPLTDKIREADVDNPKGYYEFERVKKLPEDTAWLPDAVGKVVKCLAEPVMKLPGDYRYKIVYIERDVNEMIESQNKMLVRRGEDPDKVSKEELRTMWAVYGKKLRRWLDNKPNVRVIYVNYNEILREPEPTISKINGFFKGKLDETAMLAAIDDRLYRNRK